MGSAVPHLDKTKFREFYGCSLHLNICTNVAEDFKGACTKLGEVLPAVDSPTLLAAVDLMIGLTAAEIKVSQARSRMALTHAEEIFDTARDFPPVFKYIVQIEALRIAAEAVKKLGFVREALDRCAAATALAQERPGAYCDEVCEVLRDLKADLDAEPAEPAVDKSTDDESADVDEPASNEAATEQAEPVAAEPVAAAPVAAAPVAAAPVAAAPVAAAPVAAAPADDEQADPFDDEPAAGDQADPFDDEPAAGEQADPSDDEPAADEQAEPAAAAPAANEQGEAADEPADDEPADDEPTPRQRRRRIG